MNNSKVKTITNMVLPLCMLGSFLLSFQGCGRTESLRLVDAGITPPVAEAVTDYLPAEYTDGEVFDVFSHESTPENILELEPELEAIDQENELIPLEEDSGLVQLAPEVDRQIIPNTEAGIYVGTFVEETTPVKNPVKSQNQTTLDYLVISNSNPAQSLGGDSATSGYGITSSSVDTDLEFIIGCDDLIEVEVNDKESVDRNASNKLKAQTHVGNKSEKQPVNYKDVMKKLGNAIKPSVDPAAGEFISLVDFEASNEVESDNVLSGELPFYEVGIDGAQEIVGDIDKPNMMQLSSNFVNREDDTLAATKEIAGLIPGDKEVDSHSQNQIMNDVSGKTSFYNVDGVGDSPMLAQAQNYETKIMRIKSDRKKSIPLTISEKNNDYKEDNNKKSVVRLTLAEALRMSLSSNPDVNAASYVSKQAEERINASKSVYDPTLYQNLSGESKNDLDADYYYQNMSPGMNNSGWSIETGVKQHLPTGGNISVAYEYAETQQNGIGKEIFKGTGGPVMTIKQSLLRGLGDIDNRTAIKVSRLNASITQADFVATSMDNAYEVCSVYWTLVFYLEQMAIQKRVLAMAKEVYEYELTRKTTGITRQLNVERAYAAVEVRRSGLLRARDNVLEALDQLVLLIGNEKTFQNADLVLPTDRPMTSFTEFEPSLDEKTALSMRPELKKEYTGVAIGQARRRQAGMNSLPTLDFEARYGLGQGRLGMNDYVLGNRYDHDDYNAGYWKVGLSFEYQIGSRAATAAGREAEAFISEKKAMIEKAKRQIKVEVRSAGRTLTTAQKNMKITFKARQAAIDVLEGERVRFKLGLTTNEELLRSQEYLAERETDYFRAIIDCNVNALKLARARGTILRDLGIDISGMRSY